MLGQAGGERLIEPLCGLCLFIASAIRCSYLGGLLWRQAESVAGVRDCCASDGVGLAGQLHTGHCVIRVLGQRDNHCDTQHFNNHSACRTRHRLYLEAYFLLPGGYRCGVPGVTPRRLVGCSSTVVDALPFELIAELALRAVTTARRLTIAALWAG